MANQLHPSVCDQFFGKPRINNLIQLIELRLADIGYICIDVFHIGECHLGPAKHKHSTVIVLVDWLQRVYIPTARCLAFSTITKRRVNLPA